MTGRILTCVYCGHEYPQDTPAFGSKVLTDHIASCDQHPMRTVALQRDRLRSALAAVIGVSGPDDLRAMRCILLDSAAPDGEKVVLIAAVDALLETQ